MRVHTLGCRVLGAPSPPTRHQDCAVLGQVTPSSGRSPRPREGTRGLAAGKPAGTGAPCHVLYSFSMVAVTKHQDGLRPQEPRLSPARRPETEIRERAASVPSEASLLGSWTRSLNLTTFRAGARCCAGRSVLCWVLSLAGCWVLCAVCSAGCWVLCWVLCLAGCCRLVSGRPPSCQGPDDRVYSGHIPVLPGSLAPLSAESGYVGSLWNDPE